MSNVKVVALQESRTNTTHYIRLYDKRIDKRNSERKKREEKEKKERRVKKENTKERERTEDR